MLECKQSLPKFCLQNKSFEINHSKLTVLVNIKSVSQMISLPFTIIFISVENNLHLDDPPQKNIYK